jgi:hypothetical protein
MNYSLIALCPLALYTLFKKASKLDELWKRGRSGESLYWVSFFEKFFWGIF